MDYFAFYWTLPVNWAGFTALPANADEAAKASRTIRYQVARVRHWVKGEKGHLLRESVFLETRPDRGTDAIRHEIGKLITQAAQQGASVVLVDFAQAFGWRPHGPLFEMIHAAQNCILLPPEPQLIDGKWWDPVDHFRAWRELDQAYHLTRESQKATTLAIMTPLRAQGKSYAAIAQHLNCLGMKTVNGRAWTADNVRKFMVQG